MYQCMYTYFFKGSGSIDPKIVSEILEKANYRFQIISVNEEKHFLHVAINEENVEKIRNLFNSMNINIQHAIDKYNGYQHILKTGSEFLEKLVSYQDELSPEFIQLWIQILDRGKSLGAPMLPAVTSPPLNYALTPTVSYSHGRTTQTRTRRQFVRDRYLAESKRMVDQLQHDCGI